MEPYSDKKRRLLRMENMLIAILEKLGLEENDCIHCHKGVREVGLSWEETLERCYACDGVGTVIKEK